MRFVKSVINKLLGISKVGEAVQPNPDLPSPRTTESIHDNQTRALVGWIANRMGQKLQMDKEQAGNLIYLSLSQDSLLNLNHNDNNHYLLYLASCLVRWILDEEDVYLMIKEINFQQKSHGWYLVEIYEELKHELSRYLPKKQDQERVQHTEEDKVWQVYRDVIYAVTQRKFLLIRKNEVARYEENRLICSAVIEERPDIPKARELAKQKLNELGGISPSDMMSYLLVISEAITNILKHAQKGEMKIFVNDTKVHVLVEDKGPGFPLKLLPNTTLLAGYSTKKSLGQGFTLMMKMTELVLLSTIPGEGSTLILVLNRKEEEHSAGKHADG
jgi:anti-sigma regulatory factor (Ser/Thr protein kinase)